MSTLKSILSKKSDNQLMFYVNNPDKHKISTPYSFILNTMGTVLLYHLFWRREVPAHY
ncbi:hypothetical protein [Pedobacter ginsengisoli]|uniref:hypothetical protein n=1 Tax=Pedobacter ginsengisoli TaxID=363852 RepID=UPI00254FB065|nr:hypothetical protein [Pedobacter ginsengisoli]